MYYSTIPEHVYSTVIAHMATPAPMYRRCSCCYAQRKPHGPEGHGDDTIVQQVQQYSLQQYSLIKILFSLPYDSMIIYIYSSIIIKRVYPQL